MKFLSSCFPYLIVIFFLFSTSIIVHNFSRSAKFWLYLFYKTRGSFCCALQHLCMHVAFSFLLSRLLVSSVQFHNRCSSDCSCGRVSKPVGIKGRMYWKYCNVSMEFSLPKWEWFSSLSIHLIHFGEWFLVYWLGFCLLFPSEYFILYVVSCFSSTISVFPLSLSFF